ESELAGSLRFHHPRKHATVRKRQDRRPITFDDLPRRFEQGLDQMLAAELAADIREVGADVAAVLAHAMTAYAAGKGLVREDLLPARWVSLRLECKTGQFVMRWTGRRGEHGGQRDRGPTEQPRGACEDHFGVSSRLERIASAVHCASGLTSTFRASPYSR